MFYLEIYEVIRILGNAIVTDKEFEIEFAFAQATCLLDQLEDQHVFDYVSSPSQERFGIVSRYESPTLDITVRMPRLACENTPIVKNAQSHCININLTDENGEMHIWEFSFNPQRRWNRIFINNKLNYQGQVA